jgi:hypothetical protein
VARLMSSSKPWHGYIGYRMFVGVGIHGRGAWAIDIGSRFDSLMCVSCVTKSHISRMVTSMLMHPCGEAVAT